MKNILLVMIFAGLASITSKAQSVKDNIEKLSRDPKTTENAAKADVKIQNKTLTASDQVNSNKAPDNTTTTSKAVRKKRQACKAKK